MEAEPVTSRGGISARILVAVAMGIASGSAVVAVASRSARVLGWFMAAAVSATLVSAVVEAFERRVGHRSAVIATVVIIGGIVGLVSFRVVGELGHELDRIRESMPAAVARWERSRSVGRAVRQFELGDKLKQLLDGLPSRLAGGTPGEAAQLAGSRVVAFLAGIVLTCFLSAGGRRSFEGLMAWIPERRGSVLSGHAIRDITLRAHRRTGQILLFAVTKGVGLGVMVGLSFWGAGLPAPTMLGLAFGVATLLPGLGALLAGLVGLGLVAGFTSGWTTVWCAALLVAAVAADGLIRRAANRHGVLDVGPALGAVAFFAGFEFGGIGAALCLLALGAFGASLWSEWARVRAHTAAAKAERRASEPGPDGRIAAMAGEHGPGHRVRRDLATWAWTTAIVIGALAGRGLLRGARRTLVLSAMAVVFAMALERLIGPLAARLGGRRRFAIALVNLGSAIGIVASIVVLSPVVSDKAKSFGTELPAMTERLSRLPVIGARLERANASETLQRWLQDLPADLGHDTRRITRAFWGATDALIAVLFVIALALALSVDGPRLVGHVRGVLAVRTRRTFDRAARLVLDVVGRYFAGSLLVAALAGVMALIVGLALGVVLAPLVAVWIAATNVIPQIGGLLGGTVLVAMGFATGPTAGIVCLIYFLVYQQIENHVIQPAVIGRAVSMSPAATMLVALVGGSTAGVPGAMIAVPVVGAARVVAHLLAEPGRSPG